MYSDVLKTTITINASQAYNIKWINGGGGLRLKNFSVKFGVVTWRNVQKFWEDFKYLKCWRKLQKN